MVLSEKLSRRYACSAEKMVDLDCCCDVHVYVYIRRQHREYCVADDIGKYVRTHEPSGMGRVGLFDGGLCLFVAIW